MPQAPRDDAISDEENPENEYQLDEYQKAMAAISRGLRPDPVTGEVEFTDIIRYISTHVNDPNVQTFLSESKKRGGQQREERKKALATFDVNNLRVRRNTTWLISLEYSGLTTDPRMDDNWNVPDPEDVASNSAAGSSTGSDVKEEPRQTFQLFCYIRDGPGTDNGNNSRHVEEFIGLPTSQKVEDFIKISMVKPLECFSPCIPTTLAFSHNLCVHKQALRPFLSSLPWSCTTIFETAEIRNRTRDEGYAYGERRFREYIEHATQLKDSGNDAYAKGDRAEAVARYQEAVEELETLLLRTISEEPERDHETRNLVAVCWANCSVARMLDVPGEGRDAEGAKQDAEKAIKADPGYAKGYLRLSRSQKALGDPPGAQDALTRGLRHKPLEGHWGLADHLILLQTAGNGLPKEQDAFEKWLNDVLEGDQESAARMAGIGGAWKTRCEENARRLGVQLKF